jgi:probable phosphoglycerate mutase
VHLNKNGCKQAEMLAQALKDLPIKAIYSSPLERAVETAEPLAALHGLPVQVRFGLVEVDFGDWVGKTLAQMRRNKLWKSIREQPSIIRFPGGESFGEAQGRICRDLTEIAAMHDEDDTVAIFSHADAIRLAVSYYLGMHLDYFQRLGQEPASITTLHLRKDDIPFLGMINYAVGREFKPPKKKKSRTKESRVANSTAQ